VVYVDYIVPYVESGKVIYGKLLRLVHAAAYADPVEPVEYLMVGITANLVAIVYESGMDVPAFHETGNDPSALFKH
jgi:hypothetical protein